MELKITGHPVNEDNSGCGISNLRGVIVYNQVSEKLYTQADLDKAFSMGLENAVIVLEESKHLSFEGRCLMIDMLKKEIDKDKLNATISNLREELPLRLVKR